MRAAPLGHMALLLSALTALSCGLTGARCPRPLDCARLGRHFCRRGDERCGPCLAPLVENSRGRCVVRRRQLHLHQLQEVHQVETTRSSTTANYRGHMSSYPELDQEIDVLSAIISEQRTLTLTAPPPQEVPGLTATEPATSEPALSTSPSNHSVSPSEATNHSSALLSQVSQPRPLPDDSVFIVLSSVFIVTGSVALMIAGAFWVRLQRRARMSHKLDSYGHKRNQDLCGDDRRLVQSAQMFHYQHQRALMMSLERDTESPRVPDSGASTDDENEDDFTVYECPGLAPTGEMEVKNPLFDDSTLYFHRFHK